MRMLVDRLFTATFTLSLIHVCTYVYQLCACAILFVGSGIVSLYGLSRIHLEFKNV